MSDGFNSLEGSRHHMQRYFSISEEDAECCNGDAVDDAVRVVIGEEASPERETVKRITGLDATSALIKGNLGPGCLNLPHAFALTGWALGSFFFCVVAIQGIYSMWLLTYCKQLLTDHGKDGKTFMDLARLSLGGFGQRLVQIFLFILQTGVCCVFMSLISTNLQGAFNAVGFVDVSSYTRTTILTLVLMALVLLRFIKNLRWLSAIANSLMIIAIFTAASAGLTEIEQNSQTLLPPKAGSSSFEDMATFVSAMFFAFEGIGLVMPIENSFTAGYTDPNDVRRANKRFRKWLIFSMSIVASLFVFIGVTASIGFPDIESGSVTDYLVMRFGNPWYQVVNGFVIVAVLFTFPLQLTPAVEVLDEWFGPGCSPLCCSPSSQGELIQLGEVESEGRAPEEVTTLNEGETFNAFPDSIAAASSASLLRKYEWVLRRWLMVLGCAAVVNVVSDLAALISLFGAFGQTGLAAMPCLMHLNLQRKGIAPKSMSLSFLDVIILFFCSLVMLTGCAFSLQEIWREKVV
jgi:amino acid permease